MINPRSVSYKIHVVFKYSPRLAWLDTEINHVYAVKETEDYWIKTEKYWSHLDTEVYPILGNPHVRCIVGEEVVVVPVEVRIRQEEVPCSMGIMTCVSVVKAILGLRVPWILTPRQLYNYLTKDEQWERCLAATYRA